MPDIYLLIDGQQHGPYSEELIREYLAEGRIHGDMLAWHEGLPEWVPVSSIIRSKAEPPPPPVVPPPFVPSLAPAQSTGLVSTTYPWYRSSVFVSLAIFIPFIIGPVLAVLVKPFMIAALMVVATGPIYYRKGGVLKTWPRPKLQRWLAILLLIIFVPLYLFIVGRFINTFSSAQQGANNNAHQVSSDSSESDNDDWSAQSPESMLRYATSQVKKEGVGLGTVTDATYKIGDSDGSGEVFVGEITFTVHADADSTGLPSGFTGSTTQEFHAFFSYEVEKHRWSAIRITDSNNSPLDSDSVLSTIAGYFPEPYQIALHSH